MMYIISGFLIGLLGSLHCVGMCGPIALALPINAINKFQFYFSRFLYNIGRAITYSLFGLIFGLIGSQISLIGLQQWLTIVVGVSILTYVLIPSKAKTYVQNLKPFRFFTDLLKKALGRFFNKATPTSFLLVGILNGFLPCGFVYVGIGGALLTNTPLEGAAYMFLFGMGTFPIMFLATVIGKSINVKLRQKVSRAIPYLAACLAVLFILRGMNLGIKYISPKLTNPIERVQHSPSLQKDCCQ